MKKITTTILWAIVIAFVISARAEYTDDCITFSSEASFKLGAASCWDGTLWTSTDKINWTEWKGLGVSAEKTGGTYNLYVRGNTANTKITRVEGGYGPWFLTGRNIACTGNIETLRGATGNNPSPTKMASGCYGCMFDGCTALTHAPTLPATTLADDCYFAMFEGCTALTNAPTLPATTLANRCYSEMFEGCTALTNAPSLPVTTLADGCYSGMFRDCTSLTDAPVLPAETLTDWCYWSMFRGCTALTDAPVLPAETLAEGCYSYMFWDCTALTNAPALPATTLVHDCYGEMFGGCTSLTNAPALPATTLADACYYHMFNGCTALTNAPALPATTVSNYCYFCMFRGCTALTNAPALPATTLANHCYAGMFWGCTSLTDAPVLPAETLAEGCYSYMFWGCTALEVNKAPPGKEWKIPVTSAPAMDWGYDMFTGTGGTLQDQPELNTTYYIRSAPVIDDCITFSSEGAFTLETHDKGWDGTLWTSTDKINWTEWDGEEVTAEQMGGTGSYNLYVRGDTANTVITGEPGRGWNLAGTAGIACTGNIETLRGATGDEPSPTKMANWCYEYLFWGCKSLKEAPALPATTLAAGCYREMFRDCTSLTNAPALPATTLAECLCCYLYMFRGCTSLTDAPVLPAMTLALQCYFGMFEGCTALTNAPALPATTLAEACYEDMFWGCTSLTEAPALPATTLADWCYGYMFRGCTALEVNKTAPGKEWTIPAPSTTATNWGTDMFKNTKGTLQGQPALNTTYYIKSALPVIDDCITFSCDTSFSLRASSPGWDGTLWISTDKRGWMEWDGGHFWSERSGGRYAIYVRGDSANTKITGGSGASWQLYCSPQQSIACSGNIETLRGAKGMAPSPTPMAERCYAYMFMDNRRITEAPTLCATNLASRCYEHMFEYCESLKIVPALPPATLAGRCCLEMFTGCTALELAPALPSTTLAESCYAHMFYYCTSLTDAPALPATTLAEYCYQGMFEACSSLTNAPALPATTLADACYYMMFTECTKLMHAPALPATALSAGCYVDMFSDCTALTSAPALPARELAPGCYADMFSGCTSLSNTPALPAMTLADECYDGMFSGCTALEVNKEVPGKEWRIPVASTTAKNWGKDMFTGTGGTLQGQPELNKTYYVKSALQPVVPGGEIEVPSGRSAQDFADEVNEYKDCYLKWPLDGKTSENYLTCFTAVPNGGGKVEFSLNEEGTNQVCEATTSAKTNTLESVLLKRGALVIDNPLLGFYYSLKQGGDVMVGERADLNKLAGRDELKFPLTTDKQRYFYKPLITPTPLPKE